LGNGDGTFQQGPTLAIPNDPVALAVGDFNNDGKRKLEQHLKQRYGELFGAEFDVLLYDLTSISSEQGVTW
jgi:hypothetical protein